MPDNSIILVDNQTKVEELAQNILKGRVEHFEDLKTKKGLLFSNAEIDRYIWEEEQHEKTLLTQKVKQTLRSMSSGERKKTLLKHLLSQKPDFLIVVNPFDNLDAISQQNLKDRFIELSKSITLVQISGRTADILPNFKHHFTFMDGVLKSFANDQAFWNSLPRSKSIYANSIPKAPQGKRFLGEELVRFKNISVSYNGRPILNNIDWTIRRKEYWQLIGPNGSGKTTLLTMITGDNHKGYGQHLTLFGQRKGSGESVWDVKEQIGYFTPSMVDQFRGYHSALNMILSGLYDSVGLYNEPSDAEVRLAEQWLQLLELEEKSDTLFKTLSAGEKRLIMTARAMIKHPPLLILDEPTSGLDDFNATNFVALVNKISEESDTTIVFVSHRTEKNLNPMLVLELVPSENGSSGIVKKP
nr:ATP-binding cassette domain-containing protein [Allomuricauda sp.]